MPAATPLRLAKSRLTAVARLHGACGRTSQPVRAASSPFRGGWCDPRLPGGGAGSPQGLTCAPAGAMQASNRRQAALGESQRGCCSMNGNNSKSPTTPPLPLRGTSPKGGSEEPLRIRLGAFQMVFCVPPETPPARCAVLSFALSSCTPSGTATPAKPFRGGWTRLPDGEAGSP